MLTVFENLHAINENVFHSDGILVWFLKGRPVGNCPGVKDNDIGEHSVLNETTMVETEIRRGQGA